MGEKYIVTKSQLKRLVQKSLKVTKARQLSDDEITKLEEEAMNKIDAKIEASFKTLASQINTIVSSYEKKGIEIAGDNLVDIIESKQLVDYI